MGIVKRLFRFKRRDRVFRILNAKQVIPMMTNGINISVIYGYLWFYKGIFKMTMKNN